MCGVAADGSRILPAALALFAGSVGRCNAQAFDGAGSTAFALDQLHLGDDHQVGQLIHGDAVQQIIDGIIAVQGNGIGNLIDRVLNGEVVDYINLLFMRFAVFNFADICVCVGVALWVLVIFLEESHSGNADAPKEP